MNFSYEKREIKNEKYVSNYLQREIMGASEMNLPTEPNFIMQRIAWYCLW